MRNFSISLLLIMALTSAAAPQAGADNAAANSKMMVERFINTRSAGSAEDFAAAAKMVRARADEGQPFFRFLLALYSGQDKLCELPDDKREAYLEQGRPWVREQAKSGNALAQYLVALDALLNREALDEALDMLERAAEQDQP